MSCVGKLDYLDIKLLRCAEDYARIEKINNTSLDIAFIMGGNMERTKPN